MEKNYLEMAKAVQKREEERKESLMISHKDDFLTKIAEFVGKWGSCELDFFNMPPYNGWRICDDWFDHNTMSQNILAKWGEEAGFRVRRQWYGFDTQGEPDWIIFSL